MKLFLRIVNVVFFISLCSHLAAAQTREDWYSVSIKASEHLMDCAEKQMIHSIQSGADAEAFTVVVDKLCNLQLTLFIQSTFGLLKASGWPDKEAKKHIAKRVSDVFKSLASMYTTLQKGREKK